jgi:tRNA(Ile)-lysidine synthase
MAASPTPKPTASEACLAALSAWHDQAFGGGSGLHQAGAPPLLAVACSGGADSSALLLAAQQLWPQRLCVLHVHHGLQAAADGFEQAVRQRAERFGLPFHVAHVDARPAPGDSPEEAARTHRYASLAQLSRQAGASHVLLAQHADDQAETVLLALSRGAGLPGLAGMAASQMLQGTLFHRPWLALPGELLRQFLAERGESWVEDPSNADLHHPRNRIRHHITPALLEAFPAWRDTVARSARHAAQATELLAELAAHDLAHVGQPPRIAALRALSDARMANVLRHWFTGSLQVRAPSAAQLSELVSQVRACSTRGHGIELRMSTGQVQRQGDCLGWLHSSGFAPR